jgi:hypothetical protein
MENATTTSLHEDRHQRGGAEMLSTLNADVLSTIVSFLDAAAVAQVTVVCRRLHQLCEAPRVWAALCSSLWADKIMDTFPEHANAELPWKQRYRDSLMDSVRQLITEEELCRLVWRFRFKGASRNLYVCQ